MACPEALPNNELCQEPQVIGHCGDWIGSPDAVRLWGPNHPGICCYCGSCDSNELCTDGQM